MKILKIEVKTKRLAMIKEFYGDLMNFEIKDYSDQCIVLQAGQTTIIFNQDDKSEAFYHIAFSIPSNQFTASQQWLQHKGIDLIKKEGKDQFEFMDWPASACYFYDPDGNLIEFIAHHTTTQENNQTFQQNNILYVSEIGLPVDDVSEVTKIICESFNLSLWRGDGKQFSAIGDEHGLFIVIDKNRPWFPVNKKPGMFPTAVTIQGEKEIILQMNRQLYRLNTEPS
ncbi:Catechol-2,3-dioxygenase [Paenibacillus sp. 1_12]|uniref:VOC family protein n=1 Tax=Paenibacillus sp. 1_12 TaxID=1566278 RepID=UPI0008E4B497|nr:VOC family protein [Paenibacillus sp. 1_12]SFL53312.1 Catechol-2,3-dioxygenase [Paenibacillus sp. 1_12]